jgi:hypothetical protein
MSERRESWKDHLPVTYPCWTEKGGFSTETKLVAVVEALVRDDHWFKQARNEGDGVLCVNLDGLLQLLVEETGVQATDQVSVVRKALNKYWEPQSKEESQQTTASPWRFLKGSLWKRTREPLPPLAELALSTGEERRKAAAAEAALASGARTEARFGFCVRVVCACVEGGRVDRI